MTNISSYYQNSRYYYQQTINVSGSSYASDVNGASNTSNVNGASNSSNVGGPSQITINLGTVNNLNFDQIMELFTTGNLTMSELSKWCSGKNISLSWSSSNGQYIASFKYNNKQYTLRCNTSAASSQLDYSRVATYTVYQLKSAYGLNQQIIDEYFDIAVTENGTVKQYALKPNCGYSSVESLRNALFTKYKNDLILDNFIAGNNIRTLNGTLNEGTSNLTKTSNDISINLYNFANYAAQIGLATGTKANELRQKALDKLIEQFSKGDLAYSQTSTILNAIGVTNTSIKTSSGNYTISFKYNNKQYSITCNTSAAKSGFDSNRVNTYTPQQLTSTYKLNSQMISQYFDTAVSENGTVKQYALKPNYGYSDINSLINGLFVQYTNDLILDNFLAGKTSLAYKGNDGKTIKTTETAANLRLLNHTTSASSPSTISLTKSNMGNYANQIGLATGSEATSLRQKALDKMIQDFSTGNLAYAQVKTIADAIGVTNYSATTSNGMYNVKFTYNNKQYQISCNTNAAKLGKDDDKVELLTAELLKNNYKFSSEQLNQFFDAVVTDNNVATKFVLKSGINSINDVLNSIENDFINQILKGGNNKSVKFVDGSNYSQFSVQTAGDIAVNIRYTKPATALSTTQKNQLNNIIRNLDNILRSSNPNSTTISNVLRQNGATLQQLSQNSIQFRFNNQTFTVNYENLLNKCKNSLQTALASTDKSDLIKVLEENGFLDTNSSSYKLLSSFELIPRYGIDFDSQIKELAQTLLSKPAKNLEELKATMSTIQTKVDEFSEIAKNILFKNCGLTESAMNYQIKTYSLLSYSSHNNSIRNCTWTINNYEQFLSKLKDDGDYEISYLTKKEQEITSLNTIKIDSLIKTPGLLNVYLMCADNVKNLNIVQTENGEIYTFGITSTDDYGNTTTTPYKIETSSQNTKYYHVQNLENIPSGVIADYMEPVVTINGTPTAYRIKNGKTENDFNRELKENTINGKLETLFGGYNNLCKNGNDGNKEYLNEPTEYTMMTCLLGNTSLGRLKLNQITQASNAIPKLISGLKDCLNVKYIDNEEKNRIQEYIAIAELYEVTKDKTAVVEINGKRETISLFEYYKQYVNSPTYMDQEIFHKSDNSRASVYGMYQKQNISYNQLFSFIDLENTTRLSKAEALALLANSTAIGFTDEQENLLREYVDADCKVNSSFLNKITEKILSPLSVINERQNIFINMFDDLSNKYGISENDFDVIYSILQEQIKNNSSTKSMELYNKAESVILQAMRAKEDRGLDSLSAAIQLFNTSSQKITLLSTDSDINDIKRCLNTFNPAWLSRGIITEAEVEKIQSNATQFVLQNYQYTEIIDESVLLNACIAAQADLIEEAKLIGSDVEEYIDENFANRVEFILDNGYEAAQQPTKVAAARALRSPANNNDSVKLPDYISKELINKFGEDSYNATTITCNEKSNGDKVYQILFGEKEIGVAVCGEQSASLSVNNGLVRENQIFEKLDNGQFVVTTGRWTSIRLDEVDFYEAIEDLCSGTTFRTFKTTDDFLKFLSNAGTYAPEYLAGIENIGLGYRNRFNSTLTPITNDLKLKLVDIFKTKEPYKKYTDLSSLLDNCSDFLSLCSVANMAIARENCGKINLVWDSDRKFNAKTPMTQEYVGNCWFVAGINSCLNSSELLKQIKKMVEFEKKSGEVKSVSITIQGEKYTYSASDILKATELSSGDLDLRVFALAARDYFIKHPIIGGNPITRGGNLGHFVNFLCGSNVEVKKYSSKTNSADFLKNIKNGSIGIINIGEELEYTHKIWDLTETIKIESDHAYTVIKSDEKNLYISNPHNPTKVITLPLDVFKNNEFNCSCANVKEMANAIKNPNTTSTNNTNNTTQSGNITKSSNWANRMTEEMNQPTPEVPHIDHPWEEHINIPTFNPSTPSSQSPTNTPPSTNDNQNNYAEDNSFLYEETDPWGWIFNQSTYSTDDPSSLGNVSSIGSIQTDNGNTEKKYTYTDGNGNKTTVSGNQLAQMLQTQYNNESNSMTNYSVTYNNITGVFTIEQNSISFGPQPINDNGTNGAGNGSGNGSDGNGNGTGNGTGNATGNGAGNGAGNGIGNGSNGTGNGSNGIGNGKGGKNNSNAQSATNSPNGHKGYLFNLTEIDGVGITPDYTSSTSSGGKSGGYKNPFADFDETTTKKAQMQAVELYNTGFYSTLAAAEKAVAGTYIRLNVTGPDGTMSIAYEQNKNSYETLGAMAELYQVAVATGSDKGATKNFVDKMLDNVGSKGIGELYGDLYSGLASGMYVIEQKDLYSSVKMSNAAADTYMEAIADATSDFAGTINPDDPLGLNEPDPFREWVNAVDEYNKAMLAASHLQDKIDELLGQDYERDTAGYM